MTMNKTIQNDAQQAAGVLTKILDDEQQFTAEKRGDYRELLFVPAQIFLADFDLTVSGFTRDASTNGVCLIMPQRFRQDTEAQINLFGQVSEESSLATCCWSSKFGNAYWVSGWRLSQSIPVGRLLKENQLIEPEQRGKGRLQAAVPVSIYLPDQNSRASGFTRNLSHEGISLVSKVETKPGQVAGLEIKRLTGESSQMESLCLWGKRYGEHNWVSGWKFLL